MNKKLVGAIIALLGVLLTCYEGAILVYQRSFTETAEGVVMRVGNDLVIRFHNAALSTSPNNAQPLTEADCVFPQDERTINLKVGDTIEAYYPRGKFSEIRLDRNFTAWIPAAAAVLGGVLACGGLALAWFSSRSGENAGDLSHANGFKDSRHR